MKFFKKSNQQTRQPQSVPAGFKEVTYFDENNRQRIAIVPDKVSITFRDRSRPFEQPKEIDIDRCSLYTNHSVDCVDNVFDEIIDNYTACIEVYLSPVRPKQQLSFSSDASNNNKNKTSTTESNYFDTSSGTTL